MVYYRADLLGLPLSGPAWVSDDSYVYVTKDLHAARAYAAQRTEQEGLGWSVYRVKPIGELVVDADYGIFFPTFARCDSAILEEVIEKHPTISAHEGLKYMCHKYGQWADRSPMYDDDGYPAASPRMREARIGAALLRHLGQYAPSPLIGRCEEELVQGQTE